MKAPRPPAGVGAAGKALWSAAWAHRAFSEAELVLLAELCRTVDDLARMAAVIREDGDVVRSADGIPTKCHPLRLSVTQGRAQLRDGLKALGLVGVAAEDLTDAEKASRLAEVRSLNASTGARHRREQGR